jgi:outer membrane protein TolC
MLERSQQAAPAQPAGRCRLRRLIALLSCLAGPLGCQSIGALQGIDRSAPRGQASAAKPAMEDRPGSEDGTSQVAVVKLGAPILKGVVPAGARPIEAESAVPPAPVLPPAPESRIDLVGALNLAGVSNPTIGRALEVVRAARGELLGARALMLPTMNAGASIDLHQGFLQSSTGLIRNLRRGSLEIGAGVGARAAESTPIPGLRIFAQVAEAIYEPQAARAQVAGRSFDATAVRNDVLLEVAVRYLDLAAAQARVEVIRQSQRNLDSVVQMLASGVPKGQWRLPDLDRARSEALLLHTEEQNAEGEVAVASAELARLLSVDPATRLRVADPVLPLLQLVDPSLSQAQLQGIARNNRPEVAARTADIAQARVRLREERVRPLVPLLSVGYSADQFGGGSDQVHPRWGNYAGRQDFDVFAVWSLQNLGFGNIALQRERRAQVRAAEARLMEEINRINREVTDAYAEVAARRRELGAARRQLETSQQGFALDMERARNLRVKPIEILNSFNQLTRARQELVRIVTQYSQAQVRLFVALGQPPDVSGLASAPRDGGHLPCP